MKLSSKLRGGCGGESTFLEIKIRKWNDDHLLPPRKTKEKE